MSAKKQYFNGKPRGEAVQFIKNRRFPVNFRKAVVHRCSVSSCSKKIHRIHRRTPVMEFSERSILD